MSVGNMVGRPLGGLYIQNGENARQLFGYVYTSTSGIALISSILLIREPLSTTSSINASFARLWHHIKMNVMGILGNSKVFLPVCWMFVVGAIVPDVTGAMLSWKVKERKNVTGG